MILRIVYPNFTACHHGQSPCGCEVRVANIVLRPPLQKANLDPWATTCWWDQAQTNCWQNHAYQRSVIAPTIHLGFVIGTNHEGNQLVRGERIGNVATQVIDSTLQLVVEEIADHRHAATHPLARTAKLGVVELGHRTIAVMNC